jgi:hypothetical protein
LQIRSHGPWLRANVPVVIAMVLIVSLSSSFIAVMLSQLLVGCAYLLARFGGKRPDKRGNPTTSLE